MATAVIMPKQGQSVETCIITQWFKNKGETVSVGDILLSYETDKAAFDLESPADGILLEQFFNEGDEVAVLLNVAVIGNSSEATDSFNPNKDESSDHASISSNETVNNNIKSATETKDNATFTPDSRIRISPRAKRLAEDKNIDYGTLRGSGPNGKIITQDIENAISGNITEPAKHLNIPVIPDSEIKISPRAKHLAMDKNFQYNTVHGSGPKGRIIAIDIKNALSKRTKEGIVVQSTGIDYTEKPLSNIRKLIAKSMHSSLQNSAQLTHHMSADVRNLLEARQKIKKELTSGANIPDITLNDMICWCVIRALEKFPEANSHFLDDRIRTFHKVHLGIAVDTPRGLMVPALKNANELDLHKLSMELKTLAEACRKGGIDPELIQSTAATFTVSNLGNYGVEMFTPVINLPQVGILGVCTIINRPANLGNNTFGFVPYIGLSLTYDHRSIDGGPATLFLKEIKEQIEAFRY